MSQKFAIRLKELRKESNVNQTALSLYMKTSQETISRWENSQQEPCIDDIIALAEFFNTTTDYLLGKQDY